MAHRKDLEELAAKYLPDERLENFKIFFRGKDHDITSARLFLLGTIDALVDNEAISKEDAALAYQKIGFSETQMRLIREWFLRQKNLPPS